MATILSILVIGILFTSPAASKTVDKIASVERGVESIQNGDYETGLLVIRPLAEGGNTTAQYLLSSMFQEGLGVDQNEKEAFQWSLKSANGGHLEAQANIGWRLLQGSGAARNIDEGLRWLAKSAESGNVGAQFDLGSLYSGTLEISPGVHVKKNVTKSIYWFTQAANHGDSDAQLELGIYYSDGTDVKRDPEKERFWIKKSAAQGNEKAMEHLRARARDELMTNLAAEDVRFGKNPFNLVPMTIGFALRKREPIWVITDSAWEHQAIYTKMEYMKKAIRISLKYGLPAEAVTVRSQASGKELSYSEKPWTKVFFGETYEGKVPDYIQNELPPGMKFNSGLDERPLNLKE